MKKRAYHGLGVPERTHAGVLLKMKMLAVFVLFFNLGIFAIGLAQPNKISMKMEDATLEQVLAELKKKTDVPLFYSMDKVRSVRHLNVDVRDEEIGTFLEDLLRHTDLAVVWRDGILVIKDRSALEREQARTPDGVELKGRVKDVKGAGLPGVTVSVKGTSLGVITDADGNYRLSLPKTKDIVLVFSFVGMESQEAAYTGSPLPDIVMKESVTEMEEVVVNGIFERKKESYTGSATVVRKEELMRNGSKNLLQNLSNIDPSFRIVENLDFGSDPNRMPEIQMRGQQGMPDIKGTYSGNPNQPLFILDGFEADVTTVFDLDMNRVETVVLLKDAAAKAIYGARAANGVVVIETRRPEAGRLKVSYKGDMNITVPDLKDYNLCNAWEKYVVERDAESTQNDWFREQYLNDILSEIRRGVDTYWLAQPLHTGLGHRHSVYLEGGDERIRYGVDLLYNKVDGVMKRSGRETFTGGFSLSYRYGKLLFRNQFNVSLNKADDSPYGSFSEYTTLNPYWTPYDGDGNLKQVLGIIGGGGLNETPVGNPLWNAGIGTKNFSKYTELINNLYVEYQLMESLKLTGRLGLSKKQSVREDFYPASHTRFANYSEDRFFERGSYDKTDMESYSVRSDINANYSLLMGRHQFFLNAGFNLQENRSDNVLFSVIGFPNDRLDFIGSGKQYPKDGRPAGSEAISREIGFLSALNYSFDDRYLADLSYRASASSMFGKDRRWGQFWSAGIGWNLHREHFMEDADWLDQFKLRASTGYTGSQNFSSFQALATFGYNQSQAYDNWVGSFLLGLPNDDLKWQRTMDYNVGFDLNVLGRLNLRFDYYIQNTKDQLLDLTIPPSMGFTSYKENLGSTENKGFEVKLNGHILQDSKTDRYLSVFFSIAGNRNRIKRISNALKNYNDSNDDQLSHGSFDQVTKPLLHFKEGQSMNAIWAVRSLGIDPATGDEIFLDKDGRITTVWKAEDQVACGDAMPDCSGTFGLNMDYKGIFLNMSFYYQWGGQLYNQTLVNRVENAYIPLNVDKRIYDAVWKKPDDKVDFSYNRFKTTRPTSRFVQDLNELRMTNLNVGYDFKHCAFLGKIGLEQLKASFYMDDVFRASSVKIERGLEYPFAHTYSFSIQATF